jgi:excisionase family DNA binding protein
MTTDNSIETVAPDAPAPVEAFIKKRDVAKRLGKTVRTVDNWMQRGILPYYKIGRSIEFKWSEIEAHLAQTCRVTRGG